MADNLKTSSVTAFTPSPRPPAPKKKGFWNYVKTHKWMSGIGVVVVVVVIFFVYRAFAAGSTPTTYIFAQAQTGTLISSVSGTGQIIAGSSVDL